MELGLRAPTLTDTQFLGSCIFNEKSTISNNVLEYSPLPNQPKKWPGGQQDHGHEVVLYDQGEGYQQPKAFRSERSQEPQGVKRCPIPNFNLDHNPIFLLELQ